MRASERQRASGNKRPAWPGNASSTSPSGVAACSPPAPRRTGRHRRDGRRRPRRPARHRPGHRLPLGAAAARRIRRSATSTTPSTNGRSLVPHPWDAPDDVRRAARSRRRDRCVVHEVADRPRASTHGPAARGGGDRQRRRVRRRRRAPPRSPSSSRVEPLAGRAITPIVDELQQQVLLAEGKPYEARTSITNRILLAALDRGPDRAHASARVVAVEPVPLDDDGAMVRRAVAVSCPWRRRARARAAVAAHVRPGDDNRPRVVDEVDRSARSSPPSASSTPSPSPSSRRPARRRSRPGCSPTTSTTIAAVDGQVVSLLPSLDPAIMGWKQRDWYLGAPRPQPVRPQRQRRPDRPRRRRRRRWLGPARRRPGRHGAAPAGQRATRAPTHRCGCGRV